VLLTSPSCARSWSRQASPSEPTRSSGTTRPTSKPTRSWRPSAAASAASLPDERESLDREFRELLRVWFTRKIVVVDDYYISGDQLINLIAEETPPGYMNRVMGIQNIKGTGLDFVYRWQAWDACWRACEQLQSKDAAEAERGLRALSAFHEYGVLCLEHVREALTAVRQSPARGARASTRSLR
jgi:hypothetical protein